MKKYYDCIMIKSSYVCLSVSYSKNRRSETVIFDGPIYFSRGVRGIRNEVIHPKGENMSLR
jgi:hypothetical protein